MGLLDSLTYDPQMALGMGLLASGGNSRTPVSFGQGLASGWQNMQETAKEKQKSDLLAQQAEMQKIQFEALKQQIAQATQKNEMVNSIIKRFSGLGGNEGTQTHPGISASSLALAGLPSSMATTDQPKAQGKQSGFPLNFQDVVALKLAGGPDLTADYKIGAEGFEKKPGSFYRNPITGQDEYIADPSKGITVGADGRVIVMPGAAESLASIAGATARAQEGAKAGFDPTTITPPGGKPIMTTRGKVVDQINSTDKAAIDAWKAAGSPGPERPFNMTVGGIPIQSAEEKDRTSAGVEIDKQRALAQQQKGQGQQNLLVPLEEISNRLRNPELVLGNTPADRAKMLGHQYGMQTRATINTQRIRELSNQLTLANGSLGAGVSNADRDTYEKAYGQLSQAKSYDDMKDAIDTMTRIAKKYIQMDDATQDSLKTGDRPKFGEGNIVPFGQLRR